MNTENPFSLAKIFKDALAVPANQAIEGLPPLLTGAAVVGQIPESVRPLVHMITLTGRAIRAISVKQGELRNQALQLGDTGNKIRLEVTQLSRDGSVLEAFRDAIGQVIGILAYQVATSQQTVTLPNSGHLMVAGDGAIVQIKDSCSGCGGCHGSPFGGGFPDDDEDGLDPEDFNLNPEDGSGGNTPVNGHPFQATGAGPAEQVTVPANGDITAHPHSGPNQDLPDDDPEVPKVK